ncbi:MAG: RsmB/NOP family class I SAM-dependent RNA methyltransferase [Sulfolobales archaeon]
MKNSKIVSLLSTILYYIERYNISVEKAFVRSCREIRCSRTFDEREELYRLAREFIKSVIRLRCLYGDVSRKKLARIFIDYEWRDKTDIEPWCLYSVPEWFYNEIRDLLGDREVVELFKAFDNRVTWLRINTLKASEEKILRLLEDDGVELERDRDLWYLYRVISSRKPLRYSKAVREFLAIPQDKASCLVVEAIRPEKSDKILDLSAAPGIKSSLIAMLTEDQALIQAQDISKKRIYMMRYLMKKMNVKSVDIVLADSRKSPSRESSFDKILIDAPCSSSGAIWKDPGLRLSLLKRGKIEYYSQIQKDLLREAIRLGREIVYATCSILPEEGELVVQEIISEERDLVAVKPLENLSSGYRLYDKNSVFNRTFPHRDLSEGFFIAKLLRES